MQEISSEKVVHETNKVAKQESQDWPAKVTAKYVGYVDTVRSKTTGPALVVSRYIVYLIAILTLGIIGLAVGLILVIRLMVVATSEISFVDDGDPWLAYLILGLLFLSIGLFFWRKKEPRQEGSDPVGNP